MSVEPRVWSDRVLVIDDQEANVTLLRRILERAGYASVTGITDARQAEVAIANEQPDLILLDLHMPHLDGFALLNRLAPIRESQGFLPVLVLTADAEPAARRRALDHGASDFVTKPFDADEVLLRCRNLLRTRSLYRALAERSEQMATELVSAHSTHDLVLKALEGLHPDASLEQRAAPFVEELARTEAFDAVSILVFDPDGAVTPLAAVGSSVFADKVGVPVPDWLAERLAVRLAEGKTAVAIEADGPVADLVGPTGSGASWLTPIVEDGVRVGVLATASRSEPSEELLARGMALTTEFGAIARALLGPGLAARHEEARQRQIIQQILADRAFRPVFQPVVDIRDRRVIGLEALSRFTDGVRPDVRFADAHRLGIGLQLEEETLAAAVAASDGLPQAAWLSVNASPDLLLAEGRLARALAGSRRMIVVEITEHVAIEDYAVLRGALRSLGANVRIAIDDAGAGFASFRHVLELEPDFVKLDADLVRGIEKDPSRQALVVGMRYFAQKTGCTLIAEGIETEEERAMLDSLDIRFGQGYLLGRPAPAAELAVGALA